MAEFRTQGARLAKACYCVWFWAALGRCIARKKLRWHSRTESRIFMTKRFRLICLVCFLGTVGSATTVNPVPFVDQPLLPGRATPGSKNLRLTVTGTGFTSGSDVKWNGESLATTMVSAQKLIAQVPAAALVSAGTAPVTVVNPTPGVGISTVVLFEITHPTPITLPFE